MTRAFDQIRMSQYSDPNIKFVGSHAGVSIGEDGPSQMGLEDIAMFRTVLNSVVLYPADAIATEKLVEEAAKHRGIVFIRTTRNGTPIVYRRDEEFPIGGCKVLKESDKDEVMVVAAGVTLFEALNAYEELKDQDIFIRVIDLYSVKPIDVETIKKGLKNVEAVITVEDHYAEGGMGEAVLSALSPTPVPVHILAVRNKPKSGKPHELLAYEQISKDAIVAKVKDVLGK
jgi:transketolase